MTYSLWTHHFKKQHDFVNYNGDKSCITCPRDHSAHIPSAHKRDPPTRVHLVGKPGPIMRCTFGAHLNVGLTKRSTPCRFDGNLQLCVNKIARARLHASGCVLVRIFVCVSVCELSGLCVCSYICVCQCVRAKVFVRTFVCVSVCERVCLRLREQFFISETFF